MLYLKHKKLMRLMKVFFIIKTNKCLYLQFTERKIAARHQERNQTLHL